MRTTRQRMLVWFLRVSAIVAGLAVVPTFMPRAWMAACHEWLSMGPFPDAPLVEYLARSLSGFYALFGGLCWLASHDPQRYGTLIRCIGVTAVVAAALLFVMDLRIGLPAFWTLAEGPIVLAFGLALLALQGKTIRR